MSSEPDKTTPTEPITGPVVAEKVNDEQSKPENNNFVPPKLSKQSSVLPRKGNAPHPKRGSMITAVGAATSKQLFKRKKKRRPLPTLPDLIFETATTPPSSAQKMTEEEGSDAEFEKISNDVQTMVRRMAKRSRTLKQQAKKYLVVHNIFSIFVILLGATIGVIGAIAPSFEYNSMLISILGFAVGTLKTMLLLFRWPNKAQTSQKSALTFLNISRELYNQLFLEENRTTKKQLDILRRMYSLLDNAEIELFNVNMAEMEGVNQRKDVVINMPESVPNYNFDAHSASKSKKYVDHSSDFVGSKSQMSRFTLSLDDKASF